MNLAIAVIGLYMLAGFAVVIKTNQDERSLKDTVKTGVAWPKTIYEHPSLRFDRYAFTLIAILSGILAAKGTALNEIIMRITADSAPMFIFIFMIALVQFRTIRQAKALTALFFTSSLVFYSFSGYGSKVASMVVLIGAMIGLIAATILFFTEWLRRIIKQRLM